MEQPSLDDLAAAVEAEARDWLPPGASVTIAWREVEQSDADTARGLIPTAEATPWLVMRLPDGQVISEALSADDDKAAVRAAAQRAWQQHVTRHKPG